MDRKISVVVVDDSALVRNLLAGIINAQPDMVCVGTAADPYEAREVIRTLNPDVITLDVEMPRMDGIEFLSRLMRLRPMPVLMVSTLTERGAETTLRALELGAVDFVAKPRIGVSDGLKQLAEEITEKLRIAARARIVRGTSPAGSATHAPTGAAPGPSHRAALAPLHSWRPSPAARAESPAHRLIVIGASTGGTEATREVLMDLPADAPPVLITQHMPAGYTANYARRLDTLTPMRVKEAEHQEPLLPGHAYVAPGGLHLSVGSARSPRAGSGSATLAGPYVALLSDTEPVNRHRPSVEVLFDSAAQIAGRHAVGIILTGMGGDGARAMRAMREAGAYNIAQDEATCVVFGMPREAIRQQAVHQVLPLKAIAPHVLEVLRASGWTGSMAANHSPAPDSAAGSVSPAGTSTAGRTGSPVHGSSA